MLDKEGYMSDSTERFVGIDVSKDTLDLFADPPAPQLSTHCGYDDATVHKLANALADLAPTLVVMEASGGLEQRLAAELAACGVRLAVVNPRQVRQFARALGELAKTDALDARILCAFARAIRPQARALHDADTRDLADLLSRRRQLVDMRVQELQRQHTASSRTNMNTKRSGLGSVTTDPTSRPSARSARDSFTRSSPSRRIGGSGGTGAGMKAREPVGRRTSQIARPPAHRLAEFPCHRQNVEGRKPTLHIYIGSH